MWEHCLKRLEAEIPKNEILLWIRPLEVSIESNHISLLASNDVVLDKIESLYFKSISAAIKEIFGQGYSSSIKIHKPYVPEITEQAQSTRKNNIPSNIDHRFVFDNFIEGRSNTIALAAALQTAQTPNPEFNPLLLYGSTGLGKTHLLHSIGNEILKNNPETFKNII